MLSFFILLSLLASVWGAEICCSYGGCFNNDGTFSHLPLPDCPSEINPVFWLYTRSNRNSHRILTMSSIPNEFSGARMTVFIVHGYQNDENESWMHEMKDALLNRDDVNAVIVGWGAGANALYYPKSASNTRAVAAELGLVIDNLKSNGGATSGRIYCVGHSLGSHLCGHTGRETSIGRITGMDPAGPMFDSYSLSASLNPSCASFVDVIHSHGKGGPTFAYGTLRVLGDMDFYPNGGGIQPGCLTRDLALSQRHHETEWGVYADSLLSCSHGRAISYFTESIKDECFIAQEDCSNEENIPGSCSGCGTNCPSMGYDARGSGGNGLFYLQTTGNPPYCI